MNTTARDGLTAVQGQCVFNTDVQFIECYDGNTAWYSPAAMNSQYSFPPNDGTPGQYLTTDGNGQLKWQDICQPMFPSATFLSLDTAGMGSLNIDTNLKSGVEHCGLMVYTASFDSFNPQLTKNYTCDDLGTSIDTIYILKNGLMIDTAFMTITVEDKFFQLVCP